MRERSWDFHMKGARKGFSRKRNPNRAKAESDLIGKKGGILKSSSSFVESGEELHEVNTPTHRAFKTIMDRNLPRDLLQPQESTT